MNKEKLIKIIQGILKANPEIRPSHPRVSTALAHSHVEHTGIWWLDHKMEARMSLTTNPQ